MIDEGFVFYDDNINVKNNMVYFPIYMLMFLDNTISQEFIYKIDLSGL